MSGSTLDRIKNVERIPSKDLQVGESIGQGGYSNVFKGKWQGRDVAIKQLFLIHLPDDLVREIENEVSVMQRCNNCAQIVKLLGVCLEEGKNALILEYMKKGSLFEILKNPEIDLPLHLRYKIALDIGKGLSFLHSREILHRDLKSPNVLLDENLNAKITDFGTSKTMIQTQTMSISTQNQKDRGTIRWKAPELFKRGTQHSKETDIYSFGMILWELISRRLPFGDADDELIVISWLNNGEKETIPSGCPPEYGKLILTVWDKRPGAPYIVSELQKLLPKPKTKFWQFDPQMKIPLDPLKTGFSLIEASKADVQKVVHLFSRSPVPGYAIASVQAVHNHILEARFITQITILQKRHGNPAFQPDWQLNGKDKNIAWREYVHGLFKTLAEPYPDEDYPNVDFLPVWHSTSAEAVESIGQLGFANLATTDIGFFGQGIYGTLDLKYSYEVYYKGGLFLNFMAMSNVYPFIKGDDGSLPMGKYDARFVPVSPKNPSNPKEKFFVPCAPVTKHTYVEVIVSDPASCLPRFLVTLSPILTKSISERNPDAIEAGTKEKLLASQISPISKTQEEVKESLPPLPSISVGVRLRSQNVGSSITKKPPQEEDETDQKPMDDPQSPVALSAEENVGVEKDSLRVAMTQYEFGLRFYDGNEVKQDYKTAAKYFHNAAQQQLPVAQFKLGFCQKFGQGVVKDEVKGDKNLGLAKANGFDCEGHALALAFKYQKGDLKIKQDDEQAFRHFRLAAEYENVEAQYYLGLCYYKEQGVKKGLDLALKNLFLASNQGHADAKNLIPEVIEAIKQPKDAAPPISIPGVKLIKSLFRKSQKNDM